GTCSRFCRERRQTPRSSPWVLLLRLGEFGRDFGPLGEKARHRGLRRGRAGLVGTAVAAIAVIEAARELRAAQRGIALALDELFHALAPSLSLVGAAELSQVMHRAEDFGETHELGIVRAHVAA